MTVETYCDVALQALKLDRQNPRLPPDEDWTSQSDDRLLLEMMRRYNLQELAESIANKGFQPRHAEALLVVPDHPNDDTYIVIEGNRRLATLMLLTDSRARDVVLRRPHDWDEIVRRAQEFDLSQIPVIIYPDRSALDDYLGFRHITGPKPWRPEAKARFISKLLRAGDSVGDVAKRIGSNHRTVRRYAEAHAIFTQAAEDNIPVDQVEAGFGVFYNALTEDGVRQFLGLSPQRDINRYPITPVAQDYMERLRTLVELLYGDEAKQLDRVIRESRQLSKLSDVLKDDQARANLLRDRDLEQAWRRSGHGKTELLALLDDAYSRLSEASGKALEFADDQEFRTITRKIVRLTTDMAGRFDLDAYDD